MKAVIMAGGFGTRLRPITAHLPKPMVPVGNLPIMEHNVRLHVESVEVPCPDERKGAVMRRLIEATKGETVDLIEGARVRRGDEWEAAIPDPDRPCLHVVAESTDRGRARLLVEEFRDRITAWRKEAA